MAADLCMSVDLPGLKHLDSGKVREIYEHDDHIVLVSTDRISAFDVVFGQGIPDKGRVLTQLAAWWFGQTAAIVPNHFITADLAQMPEPIRSHPELAGRTTFCKRAGVLPIECVARGYLEGSGWKEYQASGAVCGIPLPPGLRRRSRLPEPIFTPATKAERGNHDENITFERAAGIVGDDMAASLRELTLKLYTHAHDYLEPRGIVLADTKFEFGLREGEIILVDEILTPDSSRYWVKGSFEAGGEPISFDKQYVRDYLETLDWDKTPPAPELPAEVIANTTARYREIFAKITGRDLNG